MPFRDELSCKLVEFLATSREGDTEVGGNFATGTAVGVSTERVLAVNAGGVVKGRWKDGGPKIGVVLGFTVGVMTGVGGLRGVCLVMRSTVTLLVDAIELMEGDKGEYCAVLYKREFPGVGLVSFCVRYIYLMAVSDTTKISYRVIIERRTRDSCRFVREARDLVVIELLDTGTNELTKPFALEVVLV